MTYSEFLNILESNSEEAFAAFQRRLIFTNQPILGVRTPILRRLAKQYRSYAEEILAFPDEIYEITFIKLTLVSYLPYEEFIRRLKYCVSLMDNWAICDSFKAKCIGAHRDEFLPVLEGIFQNGGEFYVRYVLVTLLSEYLHSEKYLSIAYEYMLRTDAQPYYAHMAVAWLLAEILVKHYEFGIQILLDKKLDVKTHNKGIQKAIESYRLTAKQKETLRSLKIKTNQKGT
ncbi:MAG: DNA alkylation repair protein [Clostridia bacterium]|nr:DNA alkylation repair protein [Clostridia bacterium]